MTDLVSLDMSGGSDLRRARRALGKEDFVLAVHDASFPSEADDDIGRGTPYGRGARAFFAFCRELGFTGVQLGPQGVTSRVNPSPYDGTLFSKNPLSIALETLTADGRGDGAPLLAPARLRRIVEARPGDRDHVAYHYAFDQHAAALDEAFVAFREHGSAELKAAAADFYRRATSWLEGDAAHLPEARRDGYRFAQFLVHRQHDELRRALRGDGMALLGDWQVGIGRLDAATYGALFVEGYAMGAPPSRTNPDGQPWSYAVLDPAWADAGDDDATRAGAGRRFVLARLAKARSEYDAIRLDHPHGWIDPWVYHATDPNPDLAVRRGARLFSSPDLPDHPGLARYAIARPEQIARHAPRYADDWVTSLDDGQLDRYARGFDCIVRGASEAVVHRPLVCEILSTQPYPLGRVMARYGLGRFRVTQKSDVSRADDVYRSSAAEPADWIMMGNHDTDPMWALVPRWSREKRAMRAAYIAGRLRVAEGAREAFVRELTDDAGALVHAEMADVLASDARHVSIFFPDLFGLSEVYNRPGVVDDVNWHLRVPAAYRTSYPELRRAHRALDMPYVFALALHARGVDQAEPELYARLRAAAARPLPPLE